MVLGMIVILFGKGDCCLVMSWCWRRSLFLIRGDRFLIEMIYRGRSLFFCEEAIAFEWDGVGGDRFKYAL